MSTTGPCLSVMVLTEDSGPKTDETIRAVAKELLKQVDEYVQTNKISFEPIRNESASKAINSTIWKSNKPKERHKQVELIRTLATQVMLEDGWALFHIDGDRAWSEREMSENAYKFETHVKARLQALLVSNLTQLREGSTAEDIEARAKARLNRLKLVMPFYCIESWLYQNTREAMQLSRKFRGARDVAQFQSWEQDRTALDEVLDPKESVSLGSAYNLDLATHGFPAREVRAAGKSFAAVVDMLAQDAELCDALARTYAYG